MLRIAFSFNRAAFGALVLALVVSACSDAPSPVAPAPEVSCAPPTALLVDHDPSAVSLTDLREALRHAIETLLPALDVDDPDHRLATALTAMTRETASTPMAMCRLLQLADEALRGLPAAEHTLPERDGVRHVLVLASAYALAAR